MAVNELDAKTRAVEKMKAEPGKEMAAYQAAENQLLAIRAEQKQNLALARQEGAAAIQQNAMMGQVGELIASSGGGAAVQAPVNAATQNVLAKYGAGPTISKSTQRSTQQITKQNVTINNYNTTTNNTTNNVPNTGPVQGRPVVVNRDDTGRFKVWVSNALARQNEQAAIRDKEYQRRESALTRSANKMTRKLEAISSDISKRLDPRNMGNTLGDQIKRILKIIGIGVIAANWPKVMDILGNIENKTRTFLEYIGITGRDERKRTGADSGLVRDIKYLLLGDKAKTIKGGLMEAIRVFFVGTQGQDGLLQTIKKSVRLWLDDRAREIKSVKTPGLSDGISGLASYLGKIITILLTKPGESAGAVEATKAAIDKSAGESMSATTSSAQHNKKGDFQETENGPKKSTAEGDFVMHGRRGGSISITNTDISGNQLKDNVGASIRQSGYITNNLTDANGKLNVLGIASGLSRLKNTAENSNKKYTVVSPEFLDALRDKLGINTEDLGKTKKSFKYISVPKTDLEKAQEVAQRKGMVDTVSAISGLLAGIGVITSGAFSMGATAVAAPAAAGLTYKGIQKLLNEFNGEENTLKLVETDDPAYAKNKSLNSELGLKDENLQYTILTLEDLKKIESRIGERIDNPNYSLDTDDIESLGKLGEYITGLDSNKNREVSQSYTDFQDTGLIAAREYERKQKELWDNSVLSGIGERAKVLGGEAKEFATTGYTNSISDDTSPTMKINETQETITAAAKKKVKDIKQKSNWNVDEAIDTIKNNALPGSGGKCLRYTANAISAGFGEKKPIGTYHTSDDPNLGGITWARNSGYALSALGFSRISNNTKPQKGDIHVLQPSPEWEKAGHPWGHIEMYDGNSWYSDFAQKTPGIAWGHYSEMATYRWKPEEEPTDVIENSDTTPVIPETSPQDQTTQYASNSNTTESASTTSEEDTIEPLSASVNTKESPNTSVNDIASAVIASDENSIESKLIASGFAGVVKRLDSLENIMVLAAEAGANNVDATRQVAQVLVETHKPSQPNKSTANPMTQNANKGSIS